MSTFIGTILGKFVGIYIFSTLIDYLLQKSGRFEQVIRKGLAVLISTFLFILIPTFLTKTNETALELLGLANISSLCGFIIASKFAFAFNLKSFVLSFLYGVLFWFLATLLGGFIIGLITPEVIYANVWGAITIFFGFILASLLTYYKKLPGTSTAK